MTPIAAHIPVLETERLRLRAATRADWPAYMDLQMSERAQYMGGVKDDLGAWASYASALASWLLDDIGYWAAALKDTDEAVVHLGIMKPSIFPETELGWMTTPKGEGKGYAFEAANAVLNWAFVTRGMPTLVSYIDPRNVRSIALAERLGAVRDTDAKAAHEGDLVYRHPRRLA
ncbi:MAG: GNAT family N-acetyltransferase [Paracoccaceae bacterium]